ncbi:MAG: hypothetical protein H7301_08005 [Cryobacterium sp.]|nr:hypothetical protein [Oligoflexia bacterium]
MRHALIAAFYHLSKYLLILALFAMLLTDLTPARSAEPADSKAAPLFSLTDLVRLLKTSSVETLDDFLLLLPETFRRNPVLIYSSRSTQSASRESPRVILSNNDASFLLSFTGSTHLGSDQNFEMIQFDRKTARFEFAELKFARGEKPELVRHSNSCAGCHGRPKDPRPNFESFPLWPGLYGSNGEKLGREERKSLTAFVDAAKSLPRYSALIDLEETHLEKNADGTLAGHANALLNLKLNRLNAQRVARMARKNKEYPQKKGAYLDALLCQNLSPVPFASRHFPERDPTYTPDHFTAFDQAGDRNSLSAFFWAVRPKSERMFSWTLSFGDTENTSGIRTSGVSALDYAQALVDGDDDLKKKTASPLSLRNCP